MKAKTKYTLLILLLTTTQVYAQCGLQTGENSTINTGDEIIGISTGDEIIGASTGDEIIGVSTGDEIIGASTGDEIIGQASVEDNCSKATGFWRFFK